MFIGNLNSIGNLPIGGGGGAFTNDYSLSFDGVDEYVELSSTPSALVSATKFSVSFWVKPETGVLWGNGRTIFEFYTSDTNCVRFFANSTPNPDRIGMTIGNGSNSLGYYNSLPTTGVWTNIICVYNGGGATNSDKLKIYVNGSSQTLTFTSAIPSTTSSTSSHPHKHIANIADIYYFLGKVDEFAIFDYSLTSGQVTSLYNSGVPTDLDNTSGVTAPVHWWRMGDGDTYPTINDVGTTGGNNGTMTNQEAGDITSDVPS